MRKDSKNRINELSTDEYAEYVKRKSSPNYTKEAVEKYLKDRLKIIDNKRTYVVQ